VEHGTAHAQKDPGSGGGLGRTSRYLRTVHDLLLTEGRPTSR
jgi:hypothetical protein